MNQNQHKTSLSGTQNEHKKEVRNKMKKIIVLFIMLVVHFIGTNGYAAWTEFDRGTTGCSITLSSVTARVREIIDDPNSTNGTVRYSSATIYNLINTAQRLLCVNTLCLESYVYQALTANTTEYLIPSDCIAVTRVTIDEDADDTKEYIPQLTVFHMDVDKGKQWNVAESSQIPTAYYLRNRYIGMYPVPDNAGAILTVWYIKVPALMDSEDDYIFDGFAQLEMYGEALAAYAAHQILMQEGKPEILESLSAIYAGTFNAIKAWIRYKPDHDPDMTGATY